MKTKSNIVACVRTPKQNFYVRIVEGGVYIALMNITYIAGKKRYERIYSKGSLREIYVFSSRVNCWKNNERQSKNSCLMVDYAWYVFQKGYKGQPTLYWL